MAKRSNLELLQAEAPAGVTVRHCFRAEPPLHRHLGRLTLGLLGSFLGDTRYYLVGVADDALYVMPMPRRADSTVIGLRGTELRAVTVKDGLFRTKISIDTPAKE